MNLLADIMPPVTQPVITAGVIYAVCIIWLLNAGVSITVSLMSVRQKGVPREEFDKEMLRIKEETNKLDAERRAVSAQIFAELRALSASVSQSMQDIAHSIGKLEGGRELALSLKEAVISLKSQK